MLRGISARHIHPMGLELGQRIIQTAECLSDVLVVEGRSRIRISVWDISDPALLLRAIGAPESGRVWCVSFHIFGRNIPLLRSGPRSQILLVPLGRFSPIEAIATGADK